MILNMSSEFCIMSASVMMLLMVLLYCVVTVILRQWLRAATIEYELSWLNGCEEFESIARIRMIISCCPLPFHLFSVRCVWTLMGLLAGSRNLISHLRVIAVVWLFCWPLLCLGNLAQSATDDWLQYQLLAQGLCETVFWTVRRVSKWNSHVGCFYTLEIQGLYGTWSLNLIFRIIVEPFHPSTPSFFS